LATPSSPQPSPRRRSARSWQPPALLALLSTLSLTLACGGGGGKGSTARVAAAPQITTFGPGSGAPNTVVTLEGTGFTGVTKVTFGTVAAATFSAANGGLRITATVPAGATTGPIQVTTPAGTAISTASFTVLAAPAVAARPVVTGLSPASAAPGSEISITGTGLAGASQVAFNGVAVPASAFIANSATEIRLLLPQGASSGPVTVVTAAGSADSASHLVVTAAAPAPTAPPSITSFAPASGPAGTRVALAGTHFAAPMTATFNGVATPIPVQVVSATEAVATVPAGASTGPITLVTGAGTGVSATPFTVAAVAAPALTGFSPASGPAGSRVILTGTGFTGAFQVQFNGVSAGQPQVDSDTQITISVPAGAGTGPITVVTPAGNLVSTGSFTGPGGTAPALPSLTLAVPASARAGARVDLTGTGLLGTLQVTFNGVPAPRVDIHSDTAITAEVPAAASSGPIGVTTGAGGVISGVGFTLLAPAQAPTLASVNPPAGAPGTVVTLTGTGFSADLQVSFGGQAGTVQSIATDGSSATVTVPATASLGSVPVTVVTAAGSFTPGSASFTVSAPAVPLAITGLDRQSGPVGTDVVITGVSLGQAQAVLFGTAEASFSRDSDTQITARIPDGGNGSVAIRTASGTVPAPGGAFAVTESTLEIAEWAPRFGVPGTMVQLFGRGFTGTTQVEYAGVTLDPSRFAVVDDAEIRVRIPDDATAGGRLRLVNPATGVATTDADFQLFPSRLTTLGQPLVATLASQTRGGTPTQLRLLDFPAARRSQLYGHLGYALPQAPVFLAVDPTDPTALRSGKTMPTCTLNLKLPGAFLDQLPYEIQRIIRDQELDPASVDIFIVSQDYAYTGLGTGAYRFRPQPWTDPQAPDRSAAADGAIPYDTSSEVEVGLFQAPVDFGDGGLFARELIFFRGGDNGTLFGANVHLGPDDSDAPGPYTALDGSVSLALNGIAPGTFDPQTSVGFWTLTLLNDRAAVTLHLFFNDVHQAELERLAVTADTLGELVAAIRQSEVMQTAPNLQFLEDLGQPEITHDELQADPQVQGQALLTLSGTCLIGTTSVTDRNDNNLEFTVLSDTTVQVRLPMPAPRVPGQEGPVQYVLLTTPNGTARTFVQ